MPIGGEQSSALHGNIAQYIQANAGSIYMYSMRN